MCGISLTGRNASGKRVKKTLCFECNFGPRRQAIRQQSFCLMSPAESVLDKNPCLLLSQSPSIFGPFFLLLVLAAAAATSRPGRYKLHDDHLGEHFYCLPSVFFFLSRRRHLVLFINQREGGKSISGIAAKKRDKRFIIYAECQLNHKLYGWQAALHVGYFDFLRSEVAN
jgi:hypothetical protein